MRKQLHGRFANVPQSKMAVRAHSEAVSRFTSQLKGRVILKIHGDEILRLRVLPSRPEALNRRALHLPPINLDILRAWRLSFDTSNC